VTKESTIVGIAGIFFGLLVGWIIGSHQGGPAGTAAVPQSQAPAPPSGQTAVPLDENRVAELKAAADRDPRDAATRVQLGNMYFDAERFPEAARWYESSLQIDPRNVNASTDLGIAYYYMNEADRALAQFERSLAVDPKHSKTLLNVGIVRAFGKQDLEGAANAWQQVLDIAPDSPEGRAARQALEGLRKAHPALTGSDGTSSRPGSGE
jgi:tetratricopeptide (TPR) repeat protein